MLIKKIKGSQITNLTDARYFAAWGADWLGFSVDSLSTKYVSPGDILVFKEWVDGSKITLEFGNQGFDSISMLVDKIKPDAIEIPMHSFNPEVTALDVELILRISDLESLGAIEPTSTEIYLIDLVSLGLSWDRLKAETKVWDRIQDISKQSKVILEMDLSKDNIEEVIASIPIYAINMKGGDEEKVGFKSFDELDDILEIIEEIE